MNGTRRMAIWRGRGGDANFCDHRSITLRQAPPPPPFLLIQIQILRIQKQGIHSLPSIHPFIHHSSPLLSVRLRCLILIFLISPSPLSTDLSSFFLLKKLLPFSCVLLVHKFAVKKGNEKAIILHFFKFIFSFFLSY